MVFIGGRGKDEYITRVAIKPKADDPLFKRWKTENNLVISWLINCMTNEVGENFILYKIAQEIWDVPCEMFSDKEDKAEVFEIEGILQDLRQEDQTVTKYFSRLNMYW